MISVICPIYNEEKYIEKCIESILAQDYPQNDLEVLFVDGMSNDTTRNIVDKYSQIYSFIRLLDNPNKIVPYAMNIGIKAAKGDIIIRLDAHAEYPTNYFSCLVNDLIRLNADNVGAICETLPINNSSSAIGIANALSSSFGMGNSHFRTGTKELREVDTVPFGCFHKDIFNKVGLYDIDLIRNQDDELNARIIKNGGKIYLNPTLVVKYFARDKISKVFKMFYQYGLYKPLVNKKLGSPATIRQFFPFLFLLGIIFGALLCSFFHFILIPYLIILGIYFGIGVYIGTKLSLKYCMSQLIFKMPYIYLNIHISYGLGYLIGIYKIIFRRQFYVENNR